MNQDIKVKHITITEINELHMQGEKQVIYLFNALILSFN